MTHLVVELAICMPDGWEGNNGYWFTDTVTIKLPSARANDEATIWEKAQDRWLNIHGESLPLAIGLYGYKEAE
jgi:hypothetical protein